MATLPKGEPIDISEYTPLIISYEKGGITYYGTYPQTFKQTFSNATLKNNLRFRYCGLFKEPDRFIYCLNFAYIIGNEGLVYDKKTRSFIEESGKEWTINLYSSKYLNALFLPKAHYISGVTLSCITIGSDGGFYHFVHEVIPKFFFCKDILNLVDTILVNGPHTEWKEKWLKKINIPISKIIWVSDSIHYKCEQLIFTNRLVDDQQVSKWSINAIKELLSTSNFTTTIKKPFKPIWVTREVNNTRFIKWENQILKNFPNIKKIDFTTLQIDETIQILCNASHVIGAHGAGFSNIFFCNKGAKILEIFPSLNSFKPCYSRISSLTDLSHYIVAVNFENSDDQLMGYKFLENILTSFLRE